MWLTGPGCSSELALFGENMVRSSYGSNPEPFYNKHGWNSYANLLYVDKPAGTGFSYGKKPLDYDTAVRSPRICGTLCLRSTQCTHNTLN